MDRLSVTREYYLSQLRANEGISDTVTKGALWQEIIKVLTKVMALPEQILNEDVENS